MVESDRIDSLIAAVPPALALRAGLDLGIFTRLGGIAMTAVSLGAALGVVPDRLSRLVYALASIGLLDVEDGRFRFHVEIAHPWFGLIVRYQGWLQDA